MHFTIMDENVSTTMNVVLIIANVINVIYNVPQVIKTYQTKSTRDFSSWFLSLRIVGNVIWVAYAIEVDSMLMLINNIVTVVASIFIGYYKCIEIYKDNYSDMSKKNYKQFNMECEKCKSTYFKEVTMLKKVPKLLTGSPEDTIVPFPTYRCADCHHVNEEFKIFE